MTLSRIFSNLTSTDLNFIVKPRYHKLISEFDFMYLNEIRPTYFIKIDGKDVKYRWIFCLPQKRFTMKNRCNWPDWNKLYSYLINDDMKTFTLILPEISTRCLKLTLKETIMSFRGIHKELKIRVAIEQYMWSLTQLLCRSRLTGELPHCFWTAKLKTENFKKIQLFDSNCQFWLIWMNLIFFYHKEFKK